MTTSAWKTTMIAITAVAALAMAACGSSNTDTQNTDTGAASGDTTGSVGAADSSTDSATGSATDTDTDAAAGSPIVVGVIQPYSGAQSSFGQYQDDAWTFALDKHGSSIDGHPIKLVKGDSKCEPATAVAVVRQILAKDPVVINAPDCSGDTLAILPITTKAQVPLISENLAPDITAKGSAYVWRVQASDAATNKVYGAYITEQGHRKIGIINDTTAYGVANAQTLADALTANGAEVVTQATYDIAATDHSGQILQLKNADIDAAYIEGYNVPVANVVKEARSLGLDVPIYTPTTASDDVFVEQVGKEGAEGVVFATSFLPGWSDDVATFSDEWQQKFGYAPNMDSVGMYQAAVATIEALKKAGPTASPQEVNDALASLHLTGLPEGDVSFTETGDLAAPLVMVGRWHQGKTELVKILTQP